LQNYHEQASTRMPAPSDGENHHTANQFTQILLRKYSEDKILWSFGSIFLSIKFFIWQRFKSYQSEHFLGHGRLLKNFLHVAASDDMFVCWKTDCHIILAQKALFGTTPAPALAPLTFQHWVLQQAYNNTISASLPSAILLHADKSWHQNSAHLPFGATYHTWFPSTWA
jgi:hypothetical protein